jgi:hypothetical protein
MHGSINVKSPNNTRKWQMGFNSAFKGLILHLGESLKSLSVPFRHFPRESDAGINPDLDMVPFMYTETF